LTGPESAHLRASHGLSEGLIEKRRELAGIIDELQRQLDQHWADLTHIDGVLRVLAIDLDPDKIKPKRIYRRNRYFAPSRVISAKGFDAGDAVLRVAIKEQVGDVVKRLHRRGEVEKVGRGRSIRWRL
jgi:hypothetical protein